MTFYKSKLFQWIVAVAIILCIFIFVFFTGNKYEYVDYGDVNHNAIDVSIINLIATPEKYDGKVVRITGFANIDFEANFLYSGVSGAKSCLWIDIEPEKLGIDYNKLKKVDGETVTLEGTFNMYKLGHFSEYSGTIENVSRIYYHKVNPGVYFSQIFGGR